MMDDPLTAAVRVVLGERISPYQIDRLRYELCERGIDAAVHYSTSGFPTSYMGIREVKSDLIITGAAVVVCHNP